MSAGRLRRRAAFFERERIPDGGGGYEVAWEPWGTRWAEWRPLSGEQRLQAMAQNLDVVGTLRVRWRDDLPRPALIHVSGLWLESEGPYIDEDDARRYALYDCRGAQQPQDTTLSEES